MSISRLPSHISLDYTNNLKHGFVGAVTEDYFYLSGKKAVPIKDEGKISNEIRLKMVYPDTKSRLTLLNVIKVLSYFTGIIPLAMYVANRWFRSSNNLVFKPPTNEQAINRIVSSLQNTPKEEFAKFTGYGGDSTFISFKDDDGRIWKVRDNNVGSGWNPKNEGYILESNSNTQLKFLDQTESLEITITDKEAFPIFDILVNQFGVNKLSEELSQAKAALDASNANKLQASESDKKAEADKKISAS